MELIIELIMEVLVEGFFEGFVYLAKAFVPGRYISEKARKIISVCLAVVACALGFGLLIGVFLLLDSEGKSPWGWGLVTAAAVYVVLGIALKIATKGKTEKRGPEL